MFDCIKFIPSINDSIAINLRVGSINDQTKSSTVTN